MILLLSWIKPSGLLQFRNNSVITNPWHLAELRRRRMGPYQGLLVKNDNPTQRSWIQAYIHVWSRIRTSSLVFEESQIVHASERMFTVVVSLISAEPKLVLSSRFHDKLRKSIGSFLFRWATSLFNRYVLFSNQAAAGALAQTELSEMSQCLHKCPTYCWQHNDMLLL
jgi:hypothetical protein